jgi:oligoendopeptidase F
VATAVESGAQGIRWDLTPLAPSEDAMKERLDAAVADAATFVERRSADAIASASAGELATALGELADLRAARREGEYWTMLLTWTDSENPAVHDVQAWVNDRLPQLDEAIRHFELAWTALPDERADGLANDDAVARDRHYLLSVRRFGPYQLSAAEERALSTREASAASAWKSLRDRTLGPLVAPFDDGTGEREWPLSDLESARRINPDRKVRRRAQAATKALLEPVLPVLAHCYDSLVADRLAVDRLRGYTDPITPRNLENELEDGVVEGLLAAAEAHVEIAHRWFRTKASLLGLDCLDATDTAAPVGDAVSISWEEGHKLVVDMFNGLTPSIGAEVERFFSERRIDAEPRRGKPAGAFCVWPSTRVPGFVLTNWNGRLSDVLVVAHELGHGIHGALSAQAQTDNSFDTGPAIAEVPSTFAELRLLDSLMAAGDPRARPLLARTLDSGVVVSFAASAMARYEQRAYALRAEGQALTPERLSDACEAALAPVRGDAVTDDFGTDRLLWASLPHFVHERFYTYAYTFAFLLAAGLQARSHEPGFPERYEQFLAAGASAPPQELMAILEVDLGAPEIWNDGFAVLDAWIDRIES